MWSTVIDGHHPTAVITAARFIGGKFTRSRTQKKFGTDPRLRPSNGDDLMILIAAGEMKYIRHDPDPF